MTKWILSLGILTVATLIVLALLSILNYIVASLLVTAAIGIVGWILNYMSKQGEKAAPSNKKKVSEKVPKGRKWIVDKEIVLEADSYETFTLGLRENEHLLGEISSEDPINVFLVNRYSLNKFENQEDFSYEDCGCGEGIMRTRIDFTPAKAGKWFLILENEEDEETSVKIKLYVEK